MFSKSVENSSLTQELPLNCASESGCPDYRHTFGSHLAMKGESLYKISKLMGNSPEICRHHYAALTPEELTSTVKF